MCVCVCVCVCVCLSVGSLVSPEYLTQPNKKEEAKLPSHPPHGERNQVCPLSAGKPPPLASNLGSEATPPPTNGEWEEPIQETSWSYESQGVTIPEVPMEELPPMMKPFTSLTEQDTMRSTRNYVADGKEREVSASPSLLRFFTSHPQSEGRSDGRTFASDGRESVTDSVYGTASATPGT